MTTKTSAQRTPLSKKPRVVWTNPWSKQHYIYLAAGIGVILVGFGLLASGLNQWDNPLAVSVAPVVLVLGYCVLIPLAIMWIGKKQ